MANAARLRVFARAAEIGRRANTFCWTSDGSAHVTEQVWGDYLYWQKTNKAVLKRLNAMIRNALRAFFEDMAKPEPLRVDLTGYWFRRINQEHRRVQTFGGGTDTLGIEQCNYQYWQPVVRLHRA